MSAAAKGSEICATMPHSSGESRGLAQPLGGVITRGARRASQPFPSFCQSACTVPTVFPENSYSYSSPAGLEQRPLYPGTC